MELRFGLGSGGSKTGAGTDGEDDVGKDVGEENDPIRCCSGDSVETLCRWAGVGGDKSEGDVSTFTISCWVYRVGVGEESSLGGRPGGGGGISGEECRLAGRP